MAFRSGTERLGGTTMKRFKEEAEEKKMKNRELFPSNPGAKMSFGVPKICNSFLFFVQCE